jgi:hypothetical protein
MPGIWVFSSGMVTRRDAETPHEEGIFKTAQVCETFELDKRALEVGKLRKHFFTSRLSCGRSKDVTEKRNDGECCGGRLKQSRRRSCCLPRTQAYRNDTPITPSPRAWYFNPEFTTESYSNNAAKLTAVFNFLLRHFLSDCVHL